MTCVLLDKILDSKISPFFLETIVQDRSVAHADQSVVKMFESWHQLSFYLSTWTLVG